MYGKVDMDRLDGYSGGPVNSVLEAKPRELSARNDRIAALREIAAGILDKTESAADRILGMEASTGEAGDARSEPHCVMAVMDYQLDELELLLRRCAHQARRLERL